MFLSTDAEVTDFTQGQLTRAQEAVVRAAVRLRRKGVTRITDRMVQVGSGVSRSTFFLAKKVLKQLGLLAPGWKILKVGDWFEEIRARRLAVMQDIKDLAWQWKVKLHRWKQARLAQLQGSPIVGPTRKQEYKDSSCPNVFDPGRPRNPVEEALKRAECRRI